MLKIIWSFVWFAIKIVLVCFVIFGCLLCNVTFLVTARIGNGTSKNLTGQPQEYMPTKMKTQPLNGIHYIAGSTASASGGGAISVGDRFDGYYYGRDYVRGTGSPIYAPYDGELNFQSNIGGNTPQLEITSLDGTSETFIMHLNVAKTSGAVKAGELIGTTGANGAYSNNIPHEHISYYKNGILADWSTSGYSYETSILTPVTKPTDGIYIASEQYGELIKKYSVQYNLDSSIVYGLIKQESNFNSNAVSSAGAKGLMQIMPITQSDQCPSADLFDPEQNIACGTKHLRWTFDQMGDSGRLGIMAYHSGVTAQKTRGATSLDSYYADQVMGE